MADGILGRWSQRKQAAREGKPLEEPVRAAPAPAPAPVSIAATAPTPTASPLVDAAGAAKTPPAPPPPTLQDVQALTPESDFSTFTGANVSPEVSNAAMKKLFADPHYNVMDGLDIYIDDYSKPDPLPLSMLRQMASAKFLNLFDDEKDSSPRVAAPVILADNAPAPVDAGASADKPASSTTHPDVAAPEAAPPLTTTDSKTSDHADPDLRLQPNHAAGASGAGRSAQ